MKKYIWLFCAVAAVAVLLGAVFLHSESVNMDLANKAEVCFRYGNTDVTDRLSEEETESLKRIFHGKRLYRDEPSCGFGDAVSVKFDGEQTFCIARDTCPIVYWKEKNRYITLTEDEKAQLYKLLEPYGFVFPCV